MVFSRVAACAACSHSRGAASPSAKTSHQPSTLATCQNLKVASQDGGSSHGKDVSSAQLPRNFRQVAIAVQLTTMLENARRREAIAEKRTLRKNSSALSLFRGRSRTRGDSSFADDDLSSKVMFLMALREAGQPLSGLSDFAKEYGDEAFCKRLLTKYGGNVQKSAERYKQALRWREAHRELLTTRQFALGGDYRVIGADLGQRPILYQCMKNQLLPGSQALDQSLVVMLQAIDNMPAGVQTATHIWDLHGMSVRLNLNPAPLGQMLQAAEGYFAERMDQLIIIDMPRLASFLKDAVWPVVPEKTKQKVKFMTAEQAKQHLGSTCPAEVSDRIAAAMDENRDSRVSLETRRAGWKRVDASGDLVPAFAQ